MFRSGPLRSTLNMSYITGLGMSRVCTEAVHCVALGTRVTSHVWACVLEYVPKRSSIIGSTLNTSYITVWACVEYMYRSSPLRSTLNMSYITGLGMCRICSEAVHCVEYMYRSSPLRSTLNMSYITGLGMCRVCSAAHCVALWTRVTSQVWACVEYVPKLSETLFFNHISFRKKLFFFKPLLLLRKSSLLITFLFERNSFFNHIPFRKKLFFFKPLLLFRKSSFLITFLFEATLLF